MKKLLTLLTLVLGVCSGAWADETVNVSWFPSTMTSATFTVAGTADVDGIVTVNNASHSTPVSDPVFRTKNSVNWAKFSSSNVNVNGSNANRWLATDYIIFSVQIAEGVTFTPTEVTATAAGSGTGGCNAGLFATIQTTAQSGQSSGIPKEENGGKALSLTSFAKTSYAGGETLTFYIHIGIPSGKAISINNVTLTGTYAQSTKTKWGKPTFTLGDYDGSNYAITIESEAGTTIKYTVGDGSEQTSTSNTQVVNAAPGTVIKATATGVGYDDSQEATYTVPAAPKVAAPTVKMKSYNFVEGGYAVTITSTTEGASIWYKVGSDDYTETTSGSTVYLKGGQLKVKASKSGYTDSDEATIATLSGAPSLVSPEMLIPFQTSSDTYDKDADHIYKSVTVPKTYVAGIYNGKTGLKLRCGKTLKLDGSNDVNAFHLTVTEGYTVTSVKFIDLKANRAGIINVPAMYVDGVAVSAFEAFDIPETGGTPITKEFTGLNATSQIAWQLAPGTYGSSSTVDQFVAIIEVTYTAPSTTMNLNANGYATYSNSYDVEVSGAKAYTAALDVTAETITCTEIADGKVPAGAGVLLFGEANATVTLTPTTGVAALTGNDLKGTTKADGTLATVTDGANAYALSGDTFKKFTGTALTANKAYFEVTGSAPARLSIIFDEETTGIENANLNANLNDEVFDLQGRRVAQPTKGLYIVNGRKVIVR